MDITRRQAMLATLGLAACKTGDPPSSSSSSSSSSSPAGAANARIIERVVGGQGTRDGAGVKLTRALGGSALPMLDPFLLLDEFHSDNPNDYAAGFPDHPHRGFETVT